MTDIDKNRYYGIGRIVVPLVLIILLIINMGQAQGRSMQHNGKSEKHFVPLNWYTSTLTYKSAFNKLISVSFDHVSLESAIKEIARRGGARLSYHVGILANRTVTIHLTNVSVMEAVDKVLSGTDVKALGSPNNQIVLVKRSNSSDNIIASALIKQQITITGKVTDATTGEALPGVNVLVKGTTNGTATDTKGAYSLNIPSANDTLMFSYIGYTTQAIPVNGRSVINVKLKQQAISGQQLVVVGYGTQEKTTLTGSVSQVEGSSLSQAPVSNISTSIAGNVAGVSMSSYSGQPGQNNPKIHIRGVSTIGNGQPLIVVDGIKRNDINEIDPSTIKSVTVLKDAAAVAPYGMGGANGVILITTKSGEAGKPQFSLNTEYGYSSPTYYPKMLNAQDYMKLTDEAYLNENPGMQAKMPYSNAYINSYADSNAINPDKFPITNNAGKIYENLQAPRMKTTLQMSGGTDKVNYYGELGFTNQDGMFYNVRYRRYNYTVNVDAHATPTTDVHLSVIGSFENTGSVDAATSTSNLFRAGFKYRPIVNMYYSNGLWGQDAGNSPIGMINSGGYNRNNNNTLLTKIMIDQKLSFIPGLSAKLAFSYDPTQIFFKRYHRPFYFWAQDLSTNPPTYTKGQATSDNGAPSYTYLQQEYFRAQHFTYQAYLNYKQDFGKNHVTGLVVAEARNSKWTDFSAERTHYLLNIDELNLGPSNKDYFNNSGVDSTGSQFGLVYSASYNYDGKYLFQATGRYDGNYYFAPGHRWGFFPAFSAGWVLSDEQFLKLPSFIDFLKIRGSWGKTGNLAGSAYQYLNGYDLQANDYAFGSGALVPGSRTTTESNPYITWEISKQYDVGLDANFWNDMLTVNLDYFHEKRTGMLLPPAVTVPVEYGLNLSQENAGIMSNHGFEATINANSIQLGSVHLNLSGTFSFAKNKMLQIYETSATYNNPNRRRTGRAYNTPFGLHALGLFTTADDKDGDGVIGPDDGYYIKQFGTIHPGDIKYQDVNGDSVINQDDNVPIGRPPVPEITFGFTPNITWKGFDLTLLFQGSALSSMDTQGFYTIPFYNNDSNSSYEYYNNRWTPNNQNAKYPRATPSPDANNTQTSDFWYVNNAYVRLKTAVLGYTLPGSITNKLSIRKLRIYLSGQNLFTLSKVNFMDPQLTVNAAFPQYPLQTIYTVGVNINF